MVGLGYRCLSWEVKYLVTICLKLDQNEIKHLCPMRWVNLASTALIETTPSSFVSSISYESHVERNSFDMENDSQNVLKVAKNNERYVYIYIYI